VKLDEFLIARIRDDQADAMAGWRWKALPAGEYARLQAHVLADCDAKRRIIAADWRADDSGEATLIRQDVLRLLALPYADHPDYDETWRP